MLLSLQSEIVKLVLDPNVAVEDGAPSAFYSPITSAFTPEALITDEKVLDRLAYYQVRQDILKPQLLNAPFLPYLYWTGPSNYDKGQTAQPSRVVKKADFWFWCCHSTLTKALAWTDAIEASIDRLTFPYNLLHCRLTAAIFIGKHNVVEDQTIKTAQEYPVTRACIGYRFGYQSSGN